MLASTVFATSGHAQSATGSVVQAREQPVGIFVDCKGITCDADFLRTEITFVTHLRDRHDADVHVLITAQPTAEGGTELTLTFIGQQEFAGMDDILKYVSRPADSADQTRQGLTNAVQRGLVRYVNRTALAGDITLVYAPSAVPAPESLRDPWNHWTFGTSVSGFLSGEETLETMSIGVGISAGRTTEAWKISASVQSQYDSTRFQLGDSLTLSSVQRSHAFSTLVVGSVNNHLSLGVRATALASRFLNQELTLRLAPAIEYNVFPYRESTRRMLTLEYSAGGNAFDYEERTIFGRTSELRYDHRLLASLRLTQPWGSVIVAAEASHYLHDARKQRGTAFGSIDWNLARGLSVSTSLDVRTIRDQLYLAARSASQEEILLRQRQLATSYSYSASFGINYTFGSPRARIVNQRFAGSVGTMNVVQ